MKKVEIEEIPFYYCDRTYLVEIINSLLEVLSADKPRPYRIGTEDLAKTLDDENFKLYLIRIGGKVAGMASLNYHRTLTKWVAYIEDVVVLPEFQGKGLGKKIVSYLIGKAAAQGVQFIELTSNPKRKAANVLYQKLGFTIPGTNLYRLFTK